MNVRTIFVSLLLAAILMSGSPVASGERVVFIIAENEYDAANTLPEFAAELEEVYGLTCEIVQGGDNNIAGLERLAEADLAVIYVRRQVLPAGQMRHLRDYVASGKPVVGIRTASHAFHLHEEYPPEGLADWREFDRDVLGGNYHMHHGNKSETDPFTYVWVKKGMESHATLSGVPTEEFRVPSWLYKTSPLAKTATVLMMGRVGDRKPFEPVTWTNIHTGGGRVFYTSLGHPDEFKMRAFRRLLTNGIFWALNKPVPSQGEIASKLLSDVAEYEYGDSRKRLTFVEELVLETTDAAGRADLARRLAAVLEKDSTFACKQWICQQLSLVGTGEQVPVLAKMLTDEALSDIARFALERIPSERADEALRDALEKTSGEVRVGIINSIGQRRDGNAAKALGKLLSDSDRESAEAAAVALGLIGNSQAAVELKRELGKASGKRRQVLADAYLLCADKLGADGDNETALEIYARMYAPSEAKHVRITAFTGLVSTDKTEAIPHVIRELKSDDAAMRSVALGFVRELGGEDATEAFCKELPKLGAEARALLVSALGDRGDRSALPAVMEAAGSKFEGVRFAAVKALGTIGDARAVELLAKKAVKGGVEEGKAARQSLGRLRGVEINAAIMELLDGGDEAVRVEAVKSLAARKATEAVGKLLRTAEEGDLKIRAESWKALAALGTEKDLAAMIGLWVKIEGDGERKAAEDAVVAVGRGERKKKGVAAAILAAMDSVKDVNRKGSLLRALGRIGDETALPMLRAGLKDRDSQVRAAAIRALASWPSAEPMEDLRDLARGAEEEQHRVLALRGYIRLIGQADLPAGETIRLYSEAMGMAERVDEKRLVLAGLGGIGHVEALKMAESYLTDGELKNEAAAAAVGIAEEMDEADEFEDEANRQYVLSVLRKVVETSENESAVEGAQEVIEKMSQ